MSEHTHTHVAQVHASRSNALLVTQLLCGDSETLVQSSLAVFAVGFLDKLFGASFPLVGCWRRTGFGSGLLGQDSN